MATAKDFNIMPYSMIVGQQRLKMALELAYIAPRIGGVLLSGQRGTGKSTAVRAFAQMMTRELPVTIPINATEDRVVGGWDIKKLMGGEADEQQGLLEEANGGLLYVDEINLLDDHIVNIILDVTATGVLNIQREGRRERKPVTFTLVGTMNPEEGHLRGQLLDRFGLVVAVESEQDTQIRADILQTVLNFDWEVFLKKQGKPPTPILEAAQAEDDRQRNSLEKARAAFYAVTVSDEILQKCTELAVAFAAQGHRADYVMALAAQALAARTGVGAVTGNHLQQVAPLVLAHRRGQQHLWTANDDAKLTELLKE